VREIEFLDSLEVSLLTSRRSTQPYGLIGGESGAVGHNLLQRKASAHWEELGGTAFVRVQAGDVLRLETPGGGGYGEEDGGGYGEA
jgi:N-methylhydantoinase B/oxoprolinase/acetone carboxylase alpha subunit